MTGRFRPTDAFVDESIRGQRYGPDGPPMQFHHKACARDVHADVVCSECHERIDVRSVRDRLGPSHPEYVAG